MKVGYLLTNFLPTNIGGTEVYVYRLIKDLERLNIMSFVLIISNRLDVYEYVYNGIKIYEIPSTESQKFDRGRCLTKIVEIEKPDLIHVHELIRPDGFNIDTLIYLKQFDLPIITTLHVLRYSCFMQNLQYKGSEDCNGIADRVKCSNCFLAQKGMGVFSAAIASFSKFLHQNKIKYNTPFTRINTALNIYSILDRHLNDLEQIFQNSDYVVSISKWYYDVLVQFNDTQKLKLIQTGVIKTPQKVNNSVEPLVFAYIGRASFDKGLDLLIDAFIELNSSITQLNIYTEYSDKCDHFIHELLDKTKSITNIKWLRSFDPDQIANVLDNVDVVVVPTRIVEMSPLVIHEGKSLNKIIIASYNKGTIEVLSDYEYKLIYPKNTIAHLANAMSEILNTKKSFNKSDSQEHITFDNTVLNNYKLYEYTMKKKSNTSIV